MTNLNRKGLYKMCGSFADMDECHTNPCDTNADCNNIPGSFTCDCRLGYSGDGFNCTSMFHAEFIILL